MAEKHVYLLFVSSFMQQENGYSRRRGEHIRPRPKGNSMFKNKLRLLWVAAAASLLLNVTGIQAAVNAYAAENENTALEEAAASDETASDEETEDDSERKAEAASVSLPEPGDEICGFRVTKVGHFKQKNADIVSMEHEKSGAKLLYIANKDIDKAVNVFFRTRGENDKGIPHVFEHITLSGSGKYPNSNLFDQIAGSSYNTFMNASTWQQMTTYDMASLSEDQLLSIMDFYMSGLTDPLALRDEHPLKREAFRYALEDPEGEITVTGAVFNEMEAANADIECQMELNMKRMLFPGSIMSFNTGGIREDILSITLDELKSYYNTYYHPSNMLICLYGDMDYTRFLEKLDQDYLSNYDKKEISLTDDGYIPWTGYRKAVLPYAVTEDTDADGAGMVTYAVALNDLPVYDQALMTVISGMLNAESSPLVKKMQEVFPDSVYSVEINTALSTPVFTFSLQDTSEGDGELFKKTVDEAIAQIAEEGLQKDLVESVVNNERLSNILEAEEPGGINVNRLFGMYWSLSGDPLASLDYFKACDNLQEEADTGRLDDLVSEYLLDPEQSVLVEMNPDPGLKEAEDEAFAGKLSEMKAEMSISELAEMVGKTKEFNVWSELSDDSTVFDQFRAVSVQDLPEDVTASEVEEDHEDGIRKLTSVIKDAPYVDSSLLLDAGTLDYDEIHDYVFLGELLGSLPTKEKKVDELDTALNIAMYEYAFGSTIIYDDETKKPHPYFSISSTELTEKIGDSRALLLEILKDTDFSDTARIRYLASTAAASMKQDLVSSPNSAALMTALAASDEDRMYEYHATGLDYMKYLQKVASMNESELEALSEKLSAVLRKLLNKNNAIYYAIGSEESITEDWQESSALREMLSADENENQDYQEELKELHDSFGKSIAVLVNTSVNYNGYAASNRTTGFEDNALNQVLVNLIYSKITYPAFRYDIGAYGYMDRVGHRQSYMISYRDPDIRPSFDWYEKLPDLLDSYEPTREDVDDAIISTYSSYAYPVSPRNMALAEISAVLENKKLSVSEDYLKKMKEAKQVKPEDLKETASHIRKMIEDGVRVTAGNSAAIKQNSDLYDQVIDDLVK